MQGMDYHWAWRGILLAKVTAVHRDFNGAVYTAETPIVPAAGQDIVEASLNLDVLVKSTPPA